MKKTQKKLFGFLGLGLVAAMTVFAATLPVPEVAAVTSSSVTDTITVRVLASSPDVNINKPISGSVFVNPNQTIEFDYNKVDPILMTMVYTDKDGNAFNYTLYGANVGNQPGSDSLNLNLSDPGYGYGKYTVVLKGEGINGIIDEDSTLFSFVPVTGKAKKNNDTGEVDVVLDYDDNSTDLSHFIVNVYDANNNLVDALASTRINRPNKSAVLPFASKNIPKGKYTISISAYDINNVLVYKSYDIILDYDYDSPVDVPNTGGLFTGLNISKTDYLITGLIIFFTVGMGGIVFIKRGQKKTKKH